MMSSDEISAEVVGGWETSRFGTVFGTGGDVMTRFLGLESDQNILNLVSDLVYKTPENSGSPEKGAECQNRDLGVEPWRCKT